MCAMLCFLLLSIVAASPSAVLDLMKQQAIRTAGSGHTGTAYPSNTSPGSVVGLNKWSMSDTWTDGFFPGFLWQLYEVTKDEQFLTAARNWTEGIRKHASDTSTHDIGFMIFDSFGKGWQFAQIDGYKEVVFEAAKSLATRYNPTVGCTRSWDNTHACRTNRTVSTHFAVIIDNMMNLELLLWVAANGGDSSLADMAISHADQTAANHVRPDGSTFHVVDYDPDTGKVHTSCTAQGFRDNSTWSRGQAWCIAGFATVYSYTKLQRHLDTAISCAQYWLKSDSLPEDGVPLWDFDWDGETSPAYRDSSAAAVAASGFASIAEAVQGSEQGTDYHAEALRLVTSMTSSYLGDFSKTQGVVIHATTTGKYPTEASDGVNVDVSLPYADYYLLQAMRQLELF